MTKFSAVVTAHKQSPHEILGDLLFQTRPPDEILVFYSSLEPDVVRGLKRDFPNIRWFEEPDLDDWGHAKREKGLEYATGDWIGWFNHDDRYSLKYLRKMLNAARGDVKAVYCDWDRIRGCRFGAGSSTSGNFIVDRLFALEVGYPERTGEKHRYETDGNFINSLAAAADGKVVKVNELLYWHNAR